jgi:drug/metabolite transporter (DMT)-like permease
MGLVALAALFGAALFVLFKLLDRFRVDARAAIVVNYAIASTLAITLAMPVAMQEVRPILLPGALVGIAFVGIFHLLSWSIRDAGVSPTTVAAKISMVIPVIAAVIMRGDRPGSWGWIGIGMAVVAVVLVSRANEHSSDGRSRWLPLVIFLVLGAMDAAIAHIQHRWITPQNAKAFPAMVFLVAGVTSLAGALPREVRVSMGRWRTWIVGGSIGAPVGEHHRDPALCLIRPAAFR